MVFPTFTTNFPCAIHTFTRERIYTHHTHTHTTDSCCMDALLGRWLNGWRRSSTAIIQECCEQYWTNPGSNTPHGANCTATYHLSRKLYKLDEPDMPDTCWRSKDEIVSDVLLWTPAYGQSKAGRPARTFIQQLCDDTGCNPEDLPKAMNDRKTWRERVRDIRASRTSWWWWYIHSRLGSLSLVGQSVLK